MHRSGPKGELPRHIGGKYRPVRVIGRGGMSIVYEVEHEFTHDRLALKVLQASTQGLSAEALARFRSETIISALVKSDHIVRVFDADVAPELGGAPFLVMDLLHGQDLGELARQGAHPPDVVVGWFRQIARALDKAHQVGIVHRDLKPENIFLTWSPEGEPILKVLDFGVAKVRARDDADQTGTGALVGTPLYMSPEQASSDVVGPQADIWALGIFAFRLLVGKEYWDTRNVSLLLAKIVYSDIAAPSAMGGDLGSAFDAWFLRSCARNPLDRFATVGEQVEALALALNQSAEEPSVRRPVTPPPVSRRQSTAEPLNIPSVSVSIATRATVARPLRRRVLAPLAFALAAGSAGLVFQISAAREGGVAAREAQVPTERRATASDSPSAATVASAARVSMVAQVRQTGAPQVKPPSVELPLAVPAPKKVVETVPRQANRRASTRSRVSSTMPAPAPQVVASIPSTPTMRAVELPRDPLADPH